MISTIIIMILSFLLQEKDDANFKLMSERIKSNSIQKLLLEEKDLLHSQLVAINTEKQR